MGTYQLPPYHMHREMGEAVIRLAGVSGRLGATLLPETLVSVCCICGRELGHRNVARGCGGASHGICPPETGRDLSECGELMAHGTREDFAAARARALK